MTGNNDEVDPVGLNAVPVGPLAKVLTLLPGSGIGATDDMLDEEVAGCCC